MLLSDVGRVILNDSEEVICFSKDAFFGKAGMLYFNNFCGLFNILLVSLVEKCKMYILTFQFCQLF